MGIIIEEDIFYPENSLYMNDENNKVTNHNKQSIKKLNDIVEIYGEITDLIVTYFKCPRCESVFNTKENAEICKTRGEMEVRVFSKIMNSILIAKNTNTIPFIQWNKTIIPVWYIQTSTEKKVSCGNIFSIMSLSRNFDEGTNPRIGYGGFITKNADPDNFVTYLQSYEYQNVLKNEENFKILTKEQVIKENWKPEFKNLFFERSKYYINNNTDTI